MKRAKPGTFPNPHMPDIQGFKKMCGLDLTTEELEEHVATTKWGTFGPTGQEPLKYVLLKNCETDHLENILLTQNGLDPVTKLVIVTLLKRRWMELGQFLGIKK